MHTTNFSINNLHNILQKIGYYNIKYETYILNRKKVLPTLKIWVMKTWSAQSLKGIFKNHIKQNLNKFSIKGKHGGVHAW